MTEREFAIDVVRTLQQAGFAALWAGGCVRDELLGLSPNDYDVATDARPEQVQKLFRRCVAIGAAFGVIEVIGPRDKSRGGDHLTVEVATFRSDGQYVDGRRPESVTFSSPEEDANRRDFTINGMFFDPVKGELHDYVGGRADLEAKILRAIGDPAARFAEDKLRILRAVRIAARFELEIDPGTLAAAKRMAPQITVVSAERIAEELRKLLTHPNRARGVRLLREFGLVEPVLPELVPTFTLPQGLPSAPTGTLWEHLVRVVELLKGPNPPTPSFTREGGASSSVSGSPPRAGEGPGEGSSEPVSFPLAFAALLHDVGKPRVFARTADRYTFHRHEHVGKQMAEAIADRLKLSTVEKVRTAWLVEKHQYLAEAPHMRPSKLKPILVHPGIGELLALHRADALASGHGLEHVEFCEKILQETPPEELNPPPLVTGDDLIRMGLTPGREFKRLLDAVREAQLEGRLRSREDAEELVRRLRNAGAEPPA
jgi:poly(A) polymerase